jgi:hypothetical protein
MTPLKLPIDLQSFEIIRREKYLYVDKTPYIHQMLHHGRYFFMARPRRFGKTLMVSTLSNLFAGNSELFHDLWIDKHGDWSWETFPVLIFDFNTIPRDTPDIFRTALARRLIALAETQELELREPLLGQRFEELILSLYRKTGRPVVILIDEYDKPIIDHLGKGAAALEIAKANRDILKSFFGTLKGAEVASHTRFVFITGVSKFSRVSIFSDLNNLIDITMDERYAAMLGYTEDELEADFKGYIDRLCERMDLPLSHVSDRLRSHYDGYRFSEADVCVYNPFSVLRALDVGKFGNFWFETGTPTFLVNLLRERNYPLPEMESMEVVKSIFSAYDLDYLSVEALLLQTGYLTIKGVDKDEVMWRLGYPNLEVKCAFLKHLLYSFTEGQPGSEQSRFMRLSGYLKSENLNAFFETINAIFASIPYTLKGKPNEAWFHTLFYLMVSASGAHAQSEVLTSQGRIDLVAQFPDKIWIMEFKCRQSAEAGLRQIHENGYAEPYKGLNRKLLLLGIGFDPKKRMVSDWKLETFESNPNQFHLCQ